MIERNQNMKTAMLTAAALAAFVLNLHADVAELEQRVPSAKGYELLYKLSPLRHGRGEYETSNAKRSARKLKRIGYLLILKTADGKESWAFASMDTFTQNLKKAGVPTAETGIVQTFVNNLEVAGNVDGLKTGKFAKGNLEFFPGNYGAANSAAIPGADAKRYDFGDHPSNAENGHGCMQIHNFMEKQTVLAYNAIGGKKYCELGIGNNPKGQPDWTFSGSGKNYAFADLFIVGLFE